MSTFSGARLRAARTAAGLSREQLAVKISRSFFSIEGYENGKGTPSIGTLSRLAAAVGVEPGELFEEAVRAR